MYLNLTSGMSYGRVCFNPLGAHATDLNQADLTIAAIKWVRACGKRIENLVKAWIYYLALSNDRQNLTSSLESALCQKTPINYQTQSYDPIICYGNSVERTNEIAYIIRVPA